MKRTLTYISVEFLMLSISYDSAATVHCPSLSALCNRLSREPLIQKRLHNPYYINSSSFRCCSHLALNAALPGREGQNSLLLVHDKIGEMIALKLGDSESKASFCNRLFKKFKIRKLCIRVGTVRFQLK